MSAGIAKVVSGYSGDPDTRNSKFLQVVGSLEDLPIGTILYAKNTDDNTVVITQAELDRLEERCGWLDALEAAGVDNWDGWDEAREIRNQWIQENIDEA